MSYFGPQNEIGMVVALVFMPNDDHSMSTGLTMYGSVRHVRSVLLHGSHPSPKVGATMAGKSAFSPRWCLICQRSVKNIPYER